MRAKFDSSAPHVQPARSWDADLKDWGAQPDAIDGASHSSGRLLWKSADGATEAGLWLCTPGSWRLSIPKEELCHFVAGRATYREDGGDEIEVGPGSVVHFHPGYVGECSVHENLRVIYMAAPYDGPSPGGANIMREPEKIEPLTDWGDVPTMIEGMSRTSGKLLFKRDGNKAETGIWACTPGLWNCHVVSDELCHFLSGHATYTHEFGEIIEITADTAAYFPKDWRGTCRVHETVRKVYMIR